MSHLVVDDFVGLSGKGRALVSWDINSDGPGRTEPFHEQDVDRRLRDLDLTRELGQDWVEADERGRTVIRSTTDTDDDPPGVYLPSDLDTVDDAGRTITQLPSTLPALAPGDVVKAGRPSAWSWAVVEEVHDGLVYFRQIPAPDARPPAGD